MESTSGGTSSIGNQDVQPAKRMGGLLNETLRLTGHCELQCEWNVVAAHPHSHDTINLVTQASV
jgi:hypothetical protein